MRIPLILGPLLLFQFLVQSVYPQKKALNISGIWQLTDESKSENKLQKTARDNQSVNTLAESENRTMLDKLKGTYRILQQRYNTLGLVIDAANIGIQASPMVSRIINNQALLYELARDNPVILPLVYQTEIEFVTKARSMTSYLVGLCATLGDVNQMKVSDRKMLFDFILTELNTIRELSGNLVRSVQYSNLNSLARTLHPFQDYIDQDKSIIADIIRNAKYLKQ